ncbi:MAG: energy transducer TonB [Crocinitomicaceae bacterium]|nr:energy transducer TonB [Crocinitomicaceae bacterium]
MKVEIKEPCSEDWDKMKIGLISRHCDSCEKNVMDFTKMSRGEIIMHMLSNPNEQVCGRMRQGQFDFKHEDIPVLVEALRIQRPSNSFLIIALVCLSLSSCSEAPEGKIKTPPVIKDKIEHVDIDQDSLKDITPLGEMTVADLQLIEPVRIIDPSPPPPVGMITMGVPVIGPGPEILPPPPEPGVVPVSEAPLEFAEVMPEYVGGVEAMFTFINDNIKYPKYERSNGIQGNVYVRFTVEKDGNLSNIKILKSVTGSKNFDAEVVRIINKMQKWTSGENRGKKVRTYMTLPIRFVLKD